MTKREEAAFNQGVEAARQMALVAAVTLEVREGESDVRHRAASAALQGFAEGAKVLVLRQAEEGEDCR